MRTIQAFWQAFNEIWFGRVSIGFEKILGHTLHLEKLTISGTYTKGLLLRGKDKSWPKLKELKKEIIEIINASSPSCIISENMTISSSNHKTSLGTLAGRMSFSPG